MQASTSEGAPGLTLWDYLIADSIIILVPIMVTLTLTFGLDWVRWIGGFLLDKAASAKDIIASLATIGRRN